MKVDEAAELYRAATKGLRLLGQLTPLTIEDDRQRLLDYIADGRRRDLQWRVAPDEHAVSRLREAANEIRRAGGELAYAIALEDSAAGLDAAARGDTEGFADWTRRRYGAVTPELQDRATVLLQAGIEDEPERSLTSDDVADLARRILARYELLDHWSVIEREAIGARMMVSGHVVVVRQGEMFSEVEARRLMVHEVGAHVLRRANADQQPQGLARTCPFGDAWTEEGLAVYTEHALGVAIPATLRVYAARVIAIATASSAGIYETLDQLLSWEIEPTFAVDICIRSKRGHRCPESPGSFTKDLAYLGGYADFELLTLQDPNVPALLMATKWPVSRIDDLRILMVSGQARTARYLPDDRLLI